MRERKGERGKERDKDRQGGREGRIAMEKGPWARQKAKIYQGRNQYLIIKIDHSEDEAKTCKQFIDNLM